MQNLRNNDINIVAKTQIKNLAMSFFAHGGTWDDWTELQRQTCDEVVADGSLFKSAQGGDQAALNTIATTIGAPVDLVSSMLSDPSTYNAAVAAYYASFGGTSVNGNLVR